MSIEPVWELAARVAVDADATVKVIGPPPPVTWVANDKKSFSEVVEHTVGEEWLVRTETAREPAAIARHLENIACTCARDGLEEVLAVAWEEAVVSPSTQTWIPPLGQGEPIVDGVYEQILEGPEKVFVGSRPWSGPVADRLSATSMSVARELQKLGYVGRCSFDFIVLDDERARLTECNGRWGGTSIPMSLIPK